LSVSALAPEQLGAKICRCQKADAKSTRPNCYHQWDQNVLYFCVAWVFFCFHTLCLASF